jgi:hypothetical protein
LRSVFSCSDVLIRNDYNNLCEIITLPLVLKENPGALQIAEGSALNFIQHPRPKVNCFNRSDNTIYTDFEFQHIPFRTSKMDSEPTYHK